MIPIFISNIDWNTIQYFLFIHPRQTNTRHDKPQTLLALCYVMFIKSSIYLSRVGYSTYVRVVQVQIFLTKVLLLLENHPGIIG